MDSIKKLTEMFREFPGIGPRQAKRFAFYLLTRPNGYLNDFADTVKNLKQEIRLCSSCFRFFPEDSARSSLCLVCRNTERDRSSLLVVSKDVDFETVERSHSFNGLYFILGGTVPILDKDPENRIRAKDLRNTVEKRAEKET